MKGVAVGAQPAGGGLEFMKILEVTITARALPVIRPEAGLRVLSQ